jgi:hypothetical protein
MFRWRVNPFTRDAVGRSPSDLVISDRASSGNAAPDDPTERPEDARDYPEDPMFFVTTSIVRVSSSVGLNSTTSVPAKISGVCPGAT